MQGLLYCVHEWPASTHPSPPLYLHLNTALEAAEVYTSEVVMGVHVSVGSEVMDGCTFRVASEVVMGYMLGWVVKW